jgi:hypothetical protein
MEAATAIAAAVRGRRARQQLRQLRASRFVEPPPVWEPFWKVEEEDAGGHAYFPSAVYRLFGQLDAQAATLQHDVQARHRRSRWQRSSARGLVSRVSGRMLRRSSAHRSGMSDDDVSGRHNSFNSLPSVGSQADSLQSDSTKRRVGFAEEPRLSFTQTSVSQSPQSQAGSRGSVRHLFRRDTLSRQRSNLNTLLEAKVQARMETFASEQQEEGGSLPTTARMRTPHRAHHSALYKAWHALATTPLSVKVGPLLPSPLPPSHPRCSLPPPRSP